MAENSSTVGGDAISGEEALSDRPPTRVRRSSSSLFTPGKIPGKGNSLASPPYLSKVSLDAGGTGDTAPGELGKYEEAGSGHNWSGGRASGLKIALNHLFPSWRDLLGLHRSPCLCSN